MERKRKITLGKKKNSKAAKKTNKARGRVAQRLALQVKQLLKSLATKENYPVPIALKAAGPARQLVLGSGHELSLHARAKIHLIGLGKAAVWQVRQVLVHLRQQKLAQSVGKILIVTKYGHGKSAPQRAKVYASCHPQMDRRALEVGKCLVRELKKIASNDLLVVCLSGGASAMMELPRKGVDVKTFLQLQKRILEMGAPIEEMNLLRLSLSRLKGGGLLRFIKARAVIALVSSDIPSEKWQLVSSAPCFKQDWDWPKIQRLGRKWSIPVPEKGEIQTLQTSRQSEQKVFHFLLQSPATLGQLAQRKFSPASDLGCFNHSLMDVVQIYVGRVRTFLEGGSSGQHTWISTGELLLATKGTGRGGRNTHFTAYLGQKLFAENILSLPQEVLLRIAILSVGSDGSDGNSGAAGAWMDYTLWKRAEKKNLSLVDALENFDTASWFKAVGGLIKTGPTGCNLIDLRLLHIA